MSARLKRRQFLAWLGGSAAAFLAACGPTPTSSPLVAPTLLSPAPPVSPESLVRGFLDAWGKRDYMSMYSALSESARKRVAQAEFVGFYARASAEAGVLSTRAELRTVLQEETTATAQFHVAFDTALFGSIEQDNALALTRDRTAWGIVWTPANFLRELGEASSLKLYPAKSTRGNIYDRTGQPIAIGASMVAVSLWPAEMRRNGVEARVLQALAPVLNLTPLEIQKTYANSDPEWKIRIANISAEVARANAEALSLPGVITEARDSRAYPQTAAAAHLAGYVGEISPEELGEWYSQGYREGDMLGRAGLERAGEKHLSGGRGGRLVVLSRSGQEVMTLRQKDTDQSHSIYSTIDAGLQNAASTILGDKRGSIIVMDVRTGNLLALVSHPAYDPNAMVDSSRQRERQNILTSPQKLLLNRATQGAYPQGSVQKIVTTAAAIERGGMTSKTTFVDTGVWNGLGYPKTCWILAYGKTHGTVTLQRALTVSCDIAFYQIGQRLDKLDRNLMPDFAYAFGLGAPTGIEIEESTGNVPDPRKQQPWIPTDPVDMAIGQDTFLVSPLQIVDFIAAVANGGTLWRPRLIDRMVDIVNGTEEVFPSEKRGVLPVSSGTLQVIREALKGVTTDKDGTASFVFQGLPMVVAGKTGTAQVPGNNQPHAWFAGYAPADKPEIACVAMVENGGEGSQVAAPLFRKVIEKYFNIPPPAKPGAPTTTPGPGE